MTSLLTLTTQQSAAFKTWCAGIAADQKLNTLTGFTSWQKQLTGPMSAFQPQAKSFSR